MMRREAPSFQDLYHALWESLLGNHKTDKIAIALRMSCTLLGSITSSCLEKRAWNIFSSYVTYKVKSARVERVQS